MKEENKEKGEQLRRELRQLKEEQEVLEYNAKHILQEEEEEDWEISCSHTILAKMGEGCSSQDTVIQQLIYEKQDMLSTLRRKKIEFDDEFRWEIRQRRQHLECNIDKIQHQIAARKDETGEEV